MCHGTRTNKLRARTATITCNTPCNTPCNTHCNTHSHFHRCVMVKLLINSGRAQRLSRRDCNTHCNTLWHSATRPLCDMKRKNREHMHTQQRRDPICTCTMTRLWRCEGVLQLYNIKMVGCSLHSLNLCVRNPDFLCCSMLEGVAGCCSVLQCVAVCCIVLQCVANCYAKLRLTGSSLKEADLCGNTKPRHWRRK